MRCLSRYRVVRPTQRLGMSREVCRFLQGLLGIHMITNDWDKLLVDRGLMTETEAAGFYKQSEVYYGAHRHPDGSMLDKSELAPFFGKAQLQFDSRRCGYLAFRHDSILDLISSISIRRPEVTSWPAHEKHCLTISQPHNGTFFAEAWGLEPLGKYSAPILKLLSSHAEILSIYSRSNTDPCSYQRWRDGKCVRAIEFIPNVTSDGLGKVVDFGTDEFNDPTYEKRPWFTDINRALELSGHAGHLIPPRKTKDDEVLAWKLYLPDILK